MEQYRDKKVERVWKKWACEIKCYKRGPMVYGLGTKEGCEAIAAQFPGFAVNTGYAEKAQTWFVRLNTKSVSG